MAETVAGQVIVHNPISGDQETVPRSELSDREPPRTGGVVANPCRLFGHDWQERPLFTDDCPDDDAEERTFEMYLACSRCGVEKR